MNKMNDNSIILQGLSTDEFFKQFKNYNVQWILEIVKQHNENQTDSLLTRKEAAAYLKINLSTLWSWQKKGKLPTYSIGNRIYFKRSDIEKALIKIN